MDMKFDVNKILQERLAASMGLDKYRYIMNLLHDTDVSSDIDFQRMFNGFYLIRRNETWRRIYYDYFEKVKKGNPTFEDILLHMFQCTGNIEPSFSSKMLASIFPDKPIWDRYVVHNLKMKLDGKTKQDKLKNAINLYSEMEKWYEDFLQSDRGKECIESFDKALPDYKKISNVKKIDSILWSIR